MRRIVIAIDGPAGSGKSTTARLVARRLGYVYLDTGAMYRALALRCLRGGVPLDDEAALREAAEAAQIDFAWDGDSAKVTLGGEDVSEKIRVPAVSDAASKVAVFQSVRQVLVAKQREIGAGGGVVAEGRDTTTAVFPDAGLKIYMDADIKVRAERRRLELAEAGERATLNGIEEELRARDDRDSAREVSPLCRAPDAVFVDTSCMTVEEQVELVIRKAREAMEDGVRR